MASNRVGERLTDAATGIRTALPGYRVATIRRLKGNPMRDSVKGRMTRRSWRRAVVACRLGLANAGLMLMALASTAFGQGITDLTVANNAANRVDATFSTTGPGTPQHFEVRSTVATESASPSTFTTRYRFVTGYDVDSVGG